MYNRNEESVFHPSAKDKYLILNASLSCPLLSKGITWQTTKTCVIFTF